MCSEDTLRDPRFDKTKQWLNVVHINARWKRVSTA